MPPRPQGDRALTAAERQARFRARQAEAAAAEAPIARIIVRRPVDRRSRPTRWRDAVAELVQLQAEYQAWRDAMPDRLAGTATADALDAVCDIDLSDIEAIDPPRGFGRD